MTARPQEPVALHRDVLRTLWREAALGLLYPRRCPLCGEVLGFAADHPACRPVYERLLRKQKRLSPAGYYLGGLAGAAAVFSYEDEIRAAVLQMKYGGARWYGRDCGNWMAKELFGCTFFRKYGILIPERAFSAGLEYDVVVPVPGSGRGRGYNVPALLAQPLALGLGCPLELDGLVRRRGGRRQAGLPLEERLVNVAGAFSAGPGAGRVEGRRVLLVDDVITSGATVAACAQALLAAGAESVFAVGLAAADPADRRPEKRSAAARLWRRA